MHNFKLILALFFCAVFLPAQITRQTGASPAGVNGSVQLKNGTALNNDIHIQDYATAIANPVAGPTAVATCPSGACATSYSYVVFFSTAPGNHSAPSPATVVMNNATLDNTHFNTITMPVNTDPNVFCTVVRSVGGVGAPTFVQNWDFACDGVTTVTDNPASNTFLPPVFGGVPATNTTANTLIVNGCGFLFDSNKFPGNVSCVGTFVPVTSYPLTTTDFLGGQLTWLFINSDGSFSWQSDNSMAGAGVFADVASQGEAWSVTPIMGNATVTRKTGFIKCDATGGNINVTLPDPSIDQNFPVGRIFIIHKSDATTNTCTVTASAGTLIDGNATYVLTQPNESVAVYWDGTNWPTSSRLAFSKVLGSATAAQLPNAGVHTGDCVGTFPTITCGFKPLRGTSGTIMGALTIGTCNTATVTVTGATTAMVVDVSPVTNPDSGATGLVRWDGYVSSANTVTVRECGLGVVTPNATAYNVAVLP